MCLFFILWPTTYAYCPNTQREGLDRGEMELMVPGLEGHWVGDKGTDELWFLQLFCDEMHDELLVLLW